MIPAIDFQVQLNGSWVDLSSRVLLSNAGVKVTYGRESEQADTSPGIAELQLDNDDGALTLGNPASIYAPHWAAWVPCRLSIDGTRAFTGWVQTIAASWPSENGQLGTVSISCVDLIAIMEMTPSSTSWGYEAIAALAPFAWWTLSDEEGSTAGRAEAGATASPIAASQSDASVGAALVDLVSFGASGQVASLESDTMVEISEPATSDLGSSSGMLSCGVGSAPAAYTVLLTYIPLKPATTETLLGFVPDDVFVTRRGTSLVISQGPPIGPNPTLVIPNHFTVGSPRLIGLAITSPTTVRVLETNQVFTLPSPWPSPAINIGLDLVAPGRYGQLALIPGLMTQAAFQALRTQIIGDVHRPPVGWLQKAMDYAGVAATAQVRGMSPWMRRPPMQGFTPGDIGRAISKATGCRFATTRDGVPILIGRDHISAVGTLSLSEVDPDNLGWEPDPDGYVTTAINAQTGKAIRSRSGFPQAGVEIEPLMAPPDLDSLGQWIVYNGSVTGGPRWSGLSVDLATITDPAIRAELLTVRTALPRLTLEDLPPQVPWAWPVIVEGVSEVVTATGWRLDLNTSPDSRLVLDDPISLLNTFRLA